MDWNKIKLVSFDVDGTLYSSQAMRWNFTRILLERLLRTDPRKLWRDLRRIRSFHRQMNWLRSHRNPYRPEDFAELQAIEREVLRDWYGEAIARSGPKAGLKDFLKVLEAKKIPCIACSDYLCDFKLAALGVTQSFEGLYEGSRTGLLKPWPGIIVQIKADYKLAWDEILHIGDHPVKDGSWECQTQIIGESFQALLDGLERS